MIQRRKYDIGGGCTIEDDGHHLYATCRSDKTSSSVGCRRPPMGPLPDELRAIFSLNGKYFYLHDFTHPHGFWLGVKAWSSQEEMQAQQPPGLMGKAGASFAPGGRERYYRELMHFSTWDVKSEQDFRMVPRSDDMVQDYLALAQNEDRDLEKRFNEVIAPSGRTLAWIMKKIGAWEPMTESAPVVLAD